MKFRAVSGGVCVVILLSEGRDSRGTDCTQSNHKRLFDRLVACGILCWPLPCAYFNPQSQCIGF